MTTTKRKGATKQRDEGKKTMVVTTIRTEDKIKKNLLMKKPRAYMSKFFLSRSWFCFGVFSKQTFLDTFTDGGRARQFCYGQS